MPPPQKVRERIRRAVERKPRLASSYMQYHAGDDLYCEAVLCKLCGAQVRGLVPHEQYQNRLVMVSLPLYEEITIEFDDGSAHVTPLCSPCAEHLSPEDLEDIYAADMREMDSVARKRGGPVAWRRLEHRKPVRYVRPEKRS